MSGPLDGIKVVEMGVWVAGPSCGAILADWGAEVVKIEPPEGDPCRGLFAMLGRTQNPVFEQDNRGKRSVVLDLEKEAAREIAGKLVGAADVFLTNMRPRALEKFGMDWQTLCGQNERLVYCQVGGYGPDSEDANRASYDVGAFWSRAGVGKSLVLEGNPPPQQRGGMGDHMTGANAAGTIAAALYHRERTGKGQRVSVSLVRVGAYMMSWDLNTHLRTGDPIVPYDRMHAVNPIIDCYQDSEGQWFWLLMLQGDRHWPDFLRAIEAPELGEDPRFANLMTRAMNAEALVTEIDRILGTKTLAEWGPIFDRENVWWAKVNSIEEVANDPVVREAGAFVQLESPEGPVTQVAGPGEFYGTPARPRAWVPELGQHTEEVLLELGMDWDEIIALKEAGGIL